MYTATTTTAAGTGATAALAATGFDTFWLVVTGMAVIMGGIMLNRLRPKREY